MVYVLKMEYVPKINIFGLKMMVKIEIPPYAKPFLENHLYFIQRWIFTQYCKFSNKNDLFCAWREFHSTSCVLSSRLLSTYCHILKNQLEHRNHPYSILST